MPYGQSEFERLIKPLSGLWKILLVEIWKMLILVLDIRYWGVGLLGFGPLSISKFVLYIYWALWIIMLLDLFATWYQSINQNHNSKASSSSSLSSLISSSLTPPSTLHAFIKANNTSAWPHRPSLHPRLTSTSFFIITIPCHRLLLHQTTSPRRTIPHLFDDNGSSRSPC